MDPPSDPPSDNPVEPRQATTSTSSAMREDDNASSHSQQQHHQHQSEVFEADNSSSKGEASESLSLQLVTTEKSVKSDDGNTTTGESISNIKPDQLPDYKDQVRPAAAVEGESISNIKPDQLPDYKDQVRPAAAAAEGRGGGAGPTRNGGPQFKDQAQAVDEEGGGGGGEGDSSAGGSGDDTTTIPWAQSATIPWAQSVRALSLSEGVDHLLPTLQAAVLQTPPAADNTARWGGGDTQQIVLRKHMIWAVALVVIVVSVSVPLAVILNGKSTTAPPLLLSTVAPTPDAQIKLLASDGAEFDYFGNSVAINRDTIVIGAELDDTENGERSGSAYVYTRSGSVWTEQAKLTASDGAADDSFGNSVAINGDTIVIGAYYGDTENGSDSGSVYVYTLSGSVWTEQAKLTASDGAAEDWFGRSVAINGDTLVIGAYWDDTENGYDSGSAYVYTLSGSVWTEEIKLTASDGAVEDEFGYSLAINGDTIVIGAYSDDTENGSRSGSAHVYTLSGSVWTEQAKLTASDGAADDRFGNSVAINGDTIVIGAYGDDTENGSSSGSAHVYTLSGTVWTQQAKLLASDGAENDYFGRSVAINGDTIVIGAYWDDTENGYDSGSAYVYTLSGSVWTEQAKLTASDGAAGDEFGISVAINGGTIVIGAYWDDTYYDDTENGGNCGSAYIFFIE